MCWKRRRQISKEYVFFFSFFSDAKIKEKKKQKEKEKRNIKQPAYTLFPSGKSILEGRWAGTDKSIKEKMYVLFKKPLGGAAFCMGRIIYNFFAKNIVYAKCGHVCVRKLSNIHKQLLQIYKKYCKII